MEATLLHVHDPMCSWCYAFRPTWEAIVAALPAGVVPARLLGGLAPDDDRPMPPELQAKLQATWRRIARVVPGTEFNFAFWERGRPRRSTYPACRAVIAARRQDARSEDPMIAAVQRAYYREARNPADHDTLIALAAEIGLERERFAAELGSDAVDADLQREIAEARALGVSGFPTLLWLSDGVAEHLPFDYNDPRAVLDEIARRRVVREGRNR